jgi:nitric oxide dioxygenase
MLRPEVLAVLKQSVPILSEHGEAITKRFYSILFERFPDLKNVFNLSNQHSGNQARALADAIFAYAKLAETPEQLGPMVSRIAHKHVSLNIQPEHYPMVGEALLLALSEKLELPMEHEIIQAWGEAYGVLADIFINHEEGLYASNANKTGGWRDYRRFVIDKIVTETPLIKSFYLRPADDEGLALFKPGQYIGVKLDVPGHDYEETRQYSLSDKPGLAHYRISVKAEPGNPKGLISNYLHEQMATGDELLLSAPCGDFTLPASTERSTVLISGGVGITPLMSMLKEQLQQQDPRNITWVHCAQDDANHCFLEETKALQQQYGFNAYSAYLDSSTGDHQGFLDQNTLDKFLPNSEAEYYFCGPLPFMSALRLLLLARGIPEAQLHYEVFGPTLSLAA